MFNTTTAAGVTAYETKVLNDTIDARAYARSCYAADFSTPNTIACSFYTKPPLNYASKILNQTCPFGLSQSAENLDLPFSGSECNITYNTGLYLMYTGILDSHDDLGINAPPQDRIRSQKNVTCSPLFIHSANSTGDFGSSDYTEYNYGSFPSLNQNYTYLCNPKTTMDNVGYQIT
jgi:hypothetical protein